MDASRKSEPTMKNRTTVERKSERELVVTRIFDAPPRIVFEAWTKPELLKRWWVHELHPSKAAFDAASGAEAGLVEAFEQLDELLVEAGRS